MGGRWRGRRIHVTSVSGLRPTPDRVRETLFNWLAPVIEGARCLDLFAGSGALGFEALSRGAASVIMVESHQQLVRALGEQAQAIGEPHPEIVRADAVEWLDGAAAGPFDIVFLDPPYKSELGVEACVHLLNKGHLAPGGLIYLERGRGDHPPDPRLAIRKQGRAGQVQYQLLERVQGSE